METKPPLTFVSLLLELLERKCPVLSIVFFYHVVVETHFVLKLCGDFDFKNLIYTTNKC